ncbi:hypothetical protein [Actinomadura sp. 9N407]|uniref:hypothetical protein n=1 Tax=Actinomadura sp. 9N407 TaxID=3375154 RepID=UPI003798E3EA
MSGVRNNGVRNNGVCNGERRRPARLLLWSLAVAATVIVLLVLRQPLDVGDKIASVVGMVVGLAALGLTLYATFFRDAGGERQAPEALADDLAGIVGRQWREEAEARRLFEPQALRLAWSATGRPVSDHPSAVAGADRDGPPVRLRLDGELGHRLQDLARRFEALPSGRLVVLGEPGAGKSVLAILLTLGLMTRRGLTSGRTSMTGRGGGDPVPVLLPVASWDPLSERLDAWIIRSLAAGYYNGRTDNPRILHDRRLLIPVLDGLDEIPETLRSAAIREINRTVSADIPLVVTCRSAEYEEAVAGQGEVMRRAAVVEIEPVAVTDTIAYLSGVHWPPGTDWEPVFQHLREHPDGPLAMTFSTPLMVSLARTIYGRSGDPAELLDPDRFGHRQAAEDELLDMVVPAAYAHDERPGADPGTAPRWTAAQAETWLTYLAGHMHEARERDFAWWRLARRTLSAWTAPIVGIVIGAVLTIAGAPLALAWDDSPFLLLAGSGGVAIVSMVVWYATATRSPERLNLVRHGSVDRLRRGCVTGLAIFAIPTVPAVIGILVDALGDVGFSSGRPAVPIAALLPMCLVVGAGLATHHWLSASPERAAQVTPRGFLLQDRTSSLVAAAASGIAAGLTLVPTVAVSVVLMDLAGGVTSLVVDRDPRLSEFHLFQSVGLPAQLEGALAFAPIVAVTFGFMVLLSRAWPKFAVARVALALRGRTPLRLIDFLDDARARGLLRQVGGVYQFRHARLQERLVSRRARPALDDPGRNALDDSALDDSALDGSARRRSRRPVRAAMVAFCLIAAGGAVPAGNHLRCAGTWSLDPTTRMQRLPGNGGTECVGLFDGPLNGHGDGDGDGHGIGGPGWPQGADAAAYKAVYRWIDRTNRRAVRDPRHLVVVVSAPLHAAGTYGRHTLLRQLQGIALAHKRVNDTTRPLRLMIATQGTDDDTADLVRRIVSDRAVRDGRWAGLVTLGDEEIQDQRIDYAPAGANRAQLLNGDPLEQGTVSLAASADLVDSFVARYIGQHHAAAPLVVRDPRDSASTDFHIQLPAATPIAPTREGAMQACKAKADRLVVYADEPGKFLGFLRLLQRACASEYPTMLVKEHTARRIMASGDLPLSSPARGLRIRYPVTASAAAWTSCAGLRSFMGAPDAPGLGDPCGDTWGDSLLAFDLLRLISALAFHSHGRKDLRLETTNGLNHAVADMRDSPPLEGASGAITFLKGTGSTNPVRDSPIALMEAVLPEKAGGEPRLVWFCGTSRCAPGDPGRPGTQPE